MMRAFRTPQQNARVIRKFASIHKHPQVLNKSSIMSYIEYCTFVPAGLNSNSRQK